MDPPFADDRDHFAAAEQGVPPIPTGCVDWVDATGRTWSVEFGARNIVLTSGDDIVEFDVARWASDINFIPHGDGFIVRFSTFERELGFTLSGEQATPLLAHLGWSSREADESADSDEEETGHRALMWPKVSPLAVWSLLTSAAVFLPVVGVFAAVATTVLLVLHRRRVRRARAWDHSRAICLAAFLFLVAGVPVFALATQWLARSFMPPEPAQLKQAVGVAPPEGHVQKTQAASMVAQTSLEKDRNWGLIVAALLVVLLSLTVHEAAHATTAWWLGDDLARRLGRVTLNPLAHIDPFGTVILPLILLFSGAGVFGWARPVPVQMDRVARPRRAHILVSLAGPGSNLLLAAASMLLLLGAIYVVYAIAPGATINHLSPRDITSGVTAGGFALAPVFAILCTILKLSFLVNVFLAFFNLIPVPPLDGSWVLEHLFPRTFGPIYARIRPYGFLLFLGLIYAGVLKHLLTPAIIVLALGAALVEWCTPF